ncbi:NitT/TauT family transport system permease protein [Hyella patelloides LEGE 07179]|uniref:NitT/TauT family transport system permease protein n=1 Tax=Hyella patelloides LEGE 07179 TaxID=945734 RepID=A0A563W3W1_9CYAN|nr:ABC transporter permease [Hyella patelloides]VEP18368.1 NitT/TauT family transport system permease protein [Hyella patelloides LEGE 07179]
MNLTLWSKKPLYHLKPILPELVGLAIFLILWQLGAMQYGSIVLPSPRETGIAIGRLATTGQLGDALLTTSFHLLAAFTIAVLLGIFLGIIAGIKLWFKKAISPIISALQGIPPIAWIVLALLWFGTGNAVPIFTITVATLPIMFIGAVEAIQTFPTPLLEMASLFRTPQNVLLTDLYFPHLLSYIFPSLVAGLGLAWRVAVMAELLSSETGIGAELNLARINLDTDEVMAWIAIVVVSIWIGEYLILRPLRYLLEPWRRTET